MRIISFSGIDGSGKSVVSRRAQAGLRAKGLRAEVVEVYKNSSYITLGRLIGAFSGSIKSNIENMHSGENVVKKAILNFIRKACLLLDLLIFRSRMLFSHMSGSTLICDRYFYDIIVHYIFINALNDSEASFFLRIIPRPDIAILLTTDEDLAQQREGGHSDRGYYEKKNGLYKRMAGDLGLIIIDSSKDEDHTWNDIEQAIAGKKYCRILMVSRAIEPPWDEASKNLVRDIISCSGDYEFHILTAGHDYPFGKNVVKEPIYTDKAMTLVQKIRLFSFLFKHGAVFDIYHFCFTPEFFTSLFLRIIIGRRKSVQNIPYLTERIKNRDIRNLVFSDAVVVNSEYTKKMLMRNDIDNVTLVYPSVDTKKFCPETSRSFSEVKKILPGGFNVLWPCKFASDAEAGALGSIVYETACLDDNVNFAISLRLDGKVNSERYKVVKEKIKKMGIEDRVIFIENVEDMSLLMSYCDLLIYPFFPGFKKKIDIPYVIIEAMATAKPFLMSDKEPINEVIKLGGGMVLASDEPAEFAKTIIALYNDSGLREELGRRNREVALRYFDLSKNIGSYASIYRDLLKK
jgi:glycosyltransferase involved in cell wall biosynthesis